MDSIGSTYHTAYSRPIVEAEGSRSIWSSIGSAAGKACAMPLRIASTAVNGGIFAAYYVTAVAITGLAAAGGTIYGMGKIATDVVRGRPHKSLQEYAIAPARKTFNFISRLYYELPKHGAEYIFGSAGVVALAALSVIAMCSGNGGDGVSTACFLCIGASDSYGSGDQASEEGSDEDYNPSGITAALYPYRPAIVLGRKIMGKTTELLNPVLEADLESVE